MEAISEIEESEMKYYVVTLDVKKMRAAIDNNGDSRAEELYSTKIDIEFEKPSSEPIPGEDERKSYSETDSDEETDGESEPDTISDEDDSTTEEANDETDEESSTDEDIDEGWTEGFIVRARSFDDAVCVVIEHNAACSSDSEEYLHFHSESPYDDIDEITPIEVRQTPSGCYEVKVRINSYIDYINILSYDDIDYQYDAWIRVGSVFLDASYDAINILPRTSEQISERIYEQIDDRERGELIDGSGDGNIYDYEPNDTTSWIPVPVPNSVPIPIPVPQENQSDAVMENPFSMPPSIHNILDDMINSSPLSIHDIFGSIRPPQPPGANPFVLN